MFLLRTFATVVVLAAAVQKRKDNETRSASRPLLSDSTDWQQLDFAFRNDFVLKSEVCNLSDTVFFELQNNDIASTYKKSNLRLPPNKKILFYGTSFLHQVLNNILVSNGHLLLKNGPFGGFEGDKHGEDYWGYLTSWSFAINTTIVEIQNFEHLQREKYKYELENYMSQHAFDIVIFMNPHPDCYFEKLAADPSQCNYKTVPDEEGDRSDSNPLFSVIETAAGSNNVYEIEAWSANKREQWHTDQEHRIHSWEILDGHACNELDQCTIHTHAKGHQCQPGKLVEVAELVINKMHKHFEQLYFPEHISSIH